MLAYETNSPPADPPQLQVLTRVSGLSSQGGYRLKIIIRTRGAELKSETTQGLDVVCCCLLGDARFDLFAQRS